MNRRFTWRPVRRAVAATALIAGSKAGLGTSAPAGAHSLPGCGQSHPVWPTANETYAVDTSMGPGTQNAAHDSATAWHYLTEINLTENPNDIDVYATRYEDPDERVAGTASPDFNDSGCGIQGFKVQMNTVHVNYYGLASDLDEKTCIYVHEFGHSFGLAHSNEYNEPGGTDTPPPAHSASVSIMRGGEHGSRCHVTSPALTPRSADAFDIDSYY